MLKYLHSADNIIGDSIPVDFVSDSIIVSAAIYANIKDLTVIHCGSSSRHPITWGFARDMVYTYWQDNPPENKISKPRVKFVKHPKLL